MKSFVLCLLLGTSLACSKNYNIESVKDLNKNERIIVGQIRLVGFSPEQELSRQRLIATYNPGEKASIKGNRPFSDLFTLAEMSGAESSFVVRAEKDDLYIRGFRVIELGDHNEKRNYYVIYPLQLHIQASSAPCQYIGVLEFKKMGRSFALRITDQSHRPPELPQSCQLVQNLARYEK